MLVILEALLFLQFSLLKIIQRWGNLWVLSTKIMLATVYSVYGPMQLILNRIVQSTFARRQVTVLLTRIEILLACSPIWQIFSLFNVRRQIFVVGLSICKHFLEVSLKFLLPYSSRSFLLLLLKNVSSLRVVIWPLLVRIDLLSLMRGLTPSIDLLKVQSI